ncbi:sodium- and chloride-dependent glycine transporter 1-like isoform X2 [Physella acuta]|uniref:sodium- and chloride-dependent glycine transporter 1-like isoform X2 n=1 Tax=Physella acuta TaxID=109671 RepID=UPI0027DB27D7|nr:sodium- and chloride-dependent glycine transporter 1-like isoform X2 [Physella acuta]
MAETRGSWGSWLEFLLSAIGSMVGLGNIWRFPYVCYRNGGGAFLIPFFVSMIVCGCPLLFLEMLYCQYSSLGPGKVWVICPLFKGIGFGMMTLTFVVSIYYTMIMAWTLYYAALSFSSVLPWSQCLPHQYQLCGNSSYSYNEFTNETSVTNVANLTLSTMKNATYSSREEQFWFEEVLDVSSGLDEMGDVRWQLLLCLASSWVLVFLCLVKGIQSMGKVVYVAATAPYVILTCLLIRGCLLPGSSLGLYYYMIPDWTRLADFEVWRSAATQVFFSIGMGFGLISTLASYNKFNNNCYRDALLLPVLDCATSVFAGFIIFSFLGYMAHISGQTVDTVVDEGPGLVFIAYPAALSTLPVPQLWSVLFFLMLFCVGLDSQFMHVQGVTTALADCFPSQLMHRRTQLTFLVCFLSFLLGIPLTSQGGSYILNLIDWYIASFSVMLIVLIEVLVLAWIYGAMDVWPG